MYTWYDILLELLLAAAVFAVILILSKKWENQRVCRVVDDRAAPKVEGEPVAQDDTPPFSAEKSEKTPNKLSVIVQTMGSDKALVVEASPSDRVLDVKLKIQELEGTPVNLQRLIFCGRPLQNESILESYGVVNGSVVHYVSEKKRSMQLFIRQMTGTDFVVRCEENDMVEDLKRKIETIDGTDFDSMRLIYGSKQLVDSFDLRSYNIKDGSTILMMHRLVGGFSVNIRISDGRSLVVGLFDTIRELKHNICKKSGIPVSMQIVSFDGKVLEDECRREDYNIEAGYTLDLYVLRGG